MVLAAGGLAEVVGGVAAAHAVLLPVLADVVGDGDGVFGHVGRVAVLAFALVGESLLHEIVSIVFVQYLEGGKAYWLASVGVGGHGSLLLSAKLWADSSLVRAPCGCLRC